MYTLLAHVSIKILVIGLIRWSLGIFQGSLIKNDTIRRSIQDLKRVVWSRPISGIYQVYWSAVCSNKKGSN